MFVVWHLGQIVSAQPLSAPLVYKTHESKSITPHFRREATYVIRPPSQHVSFMQWHALQINLPRMSMRALAHIRQTGKISVLPTICRGIYGQFTQHRPQQTPMRTKSVRSIAAYSDYIVFGGAGAGAGAGGTAPGGSGGAPCCDRYCMSSGKPTPPAAVPASVDSHGWLSSSSS